MKLKTLLFALPLVASVAFTGCNSSGGPVANVNGDSVSMDDFNDYIHTKSTMRVRVNDQVAELPVVDTVAFQGLQDIVSRKIMMQLAKDEQVAPTDKDIEDEIAFRKKLDDSFLKEMQSRGMSLQLIRENMRTQLAQERLLTKGITVTAADVDQYIADNKNQFITPADADLTWLLVKTPAKKDLVDKGLSEGQSLAALARTYSEAPNAARSDYKFGGKLNMLAKPIQEEIDSLQVGQDTKWVQTTEGWNKFHINGKTPAKPLDMSDARKEFLRRQIAISRGQAANDLGKKIKDRMLTAKVEITDPTLKELWNAFIEQMKSDQKSTTGLPANPDTSTPAK